MSGDVTIQALKRQTYLPERGSAENGTLIAGQEYDNVYFAGGEADNLTLNDPVISGGTFDDPVVNNPEVNGTLTGDVIISGANGGTGVDNTGKTITLGGNLETSGAYNLTLTLGAATGVTLPDSGTLYGTKTASITSSQLAGSLSDETGSGSAVFGTSPSLTTPTINIPGSASFADNGNQLVITGGGSPTAGNLYGLSVIKTGVQEAFFGINKNTTTGSVPASAVYISTYTSGGQISIGRGNSAGLPNTADILVGSTGNVTLGAALTVTGKTNTAATATGGAGLNLPHGTAPSSPTNGDLWSTTSGFYGRVNGATVGPFTDHVPVTLAGENYLSLSGQQITANDINLTSNVTGVLPAANGGTGVANSNTITLGGNLTTSGAFNTTLTVTNTTNVTLPTTGTLQSYSDTAYATGSFTCPNSTGNNATTGVGFTPRFIELYSINMSTSSLYAVGSGGGTAGASRSWGIAQTGSTSNSTNAVTTNIIQALTAGSASVVVQATIVSFDADGFTLNFTAATNTHTIVWRAWR